MRILTDAAIIVKGENLGFYYTFFHKFLFDGFSIRADGGLVKWTKGELTLGPSRASGTGCWLLQIPGAGPGMTDFVFYRSRIKFGMTGFVRDDWLRSG